MKYMVESLIKFMSKKREKTLTAPLAIWRHKPFSMTETAVSLIERRWEVIANLLISWLLNSRESLSFAERVGSFSWREVSMIVKGDITSESA